jgi:hypothetical protein
VSPSSVGSPHQERPGDGLVAPQQTPPVSLKTSPRTDPNHPRTQLDGRFPRDSAIGLRNRVPPVPLRGSVRAGFPHTALSLGGCRRRGIDPWEYVRDVLTRLPGLKQSELPSLLPRCWKPLAVAAS